MKPRTYDMTFCVSKCNNKCDRHYSLYEFEEGRLYSMANFDCEEKGGMKQIQLKKVRCKVWMTLKRNQYTIIPVGI